MIELTRLNGSKFHLNPFLIELMEANPDTVITLTTGKKFIAKEPPHEVVKGIKAFLNEVQLFKQFGNSRE
jgi:flagellar protein FlbD